jgi:hypothetical protein
LILQDDSEFREHFFYRMLHQQRADEYFKKLTDSDHKRLQAAMAKWIADLARQGDNAVAEKAAVERKWKLVADQVTSL